MSRPYAKEIAANGISFIATDFDPASIVGKRHTVSSPDEMFEHFKRIVTVQCSVCDKEAEGTAESLEASGWWLTQTVVCSIECLFVRADEITAEVDKGNLPF